MLPLHCFFWAIHIVPVLGEGNIYGLSGCFSCSRMSRSTACFGMGMVRTELLVLGWLTLSWPLTRPRTQNFLTFLKCPRSYFALLSKKYSDFSNYAFIGFASRAHYSNNHSGFCVSYDMKLNPTLSSCTFPIQYISERLDVTAFMQEQAQKMCDEIDKQISEGKKEIVFMY